MVMSSFTPSPYLHECKSLCHTDEMNKHILTFCVSLLLCFIVSIERPAVSADPKKGVIAYISGDYAAALKEFRPLAEQGHAMAQTGLGVMYDHGKGVTQDYKMAVKWYRLAAELHLGLHNCAQAHPLAADKTKLTS